MGGSRAAPTEDREIMSTGKTSAFYIVLIAVAGMAVGMVVSSRLDLTPASSAQSVSLPAINSAPLTGPPVANTQTEVGARNRELTDFGGGGGGGGDDLLRRFFGGDEPQAP